jgi:L-lactate dehydrogenase complex protein LldE
VRIALAATCIADTLFPAAPAATVRLLERLGHEVVFPTSQACCGQMHVNTGYLREAVPVIRNHVETFAPVADGEWDAVVVPSGSCTGSIRHQQAMVCRRAGLDELARTADAVAAKTYELSELLVDVLGVVDVDAWFPHRVTYHPTCHSLRMLRVGDKPLRLLRAVADIDLAELPDAEGCCGFGGTFALKNADVSAAMLDDKAAAVLSTRAEVLTAGDMSCLMHIGGGLSRRRAGVRAMHLAEILASTRDDPTLLPDAVFTTEAARRDPDSGGYAGRDTRKDPGLGARSEAAR